MLRLGRRAIRSSTRSPSYYSLNVYRRHHASAHNLLIDLQKRQLVAGVTRPTDFEQYLADGARTLYVGVDPTASALHAGHLIPLISSYRFYAAGHNVIALIGGGTGLVGDPSGRATERALSHEEHIANNATALTKAIQKFFDRITAYASRTTSSSQACGALEVANNKDWLGDLNLLEFLRTAGVHFRVNQMIARDSVKTRMAAQSGISFAEFTYQLLQGYDFYMLYKRRQCTIQIGGSDQWGNILSGIELINKSERAHAEDKTVQGDVHEKGFALTTPLLTTSTGEKFGKSAGNAIWLDESMTSHLDFYQFWLKTTDADVGKYLKMFTLMPVEEIEAVISEHENAPEKRVAQRKLADEMSGMIHGEAALNKARVATQILFGTDYSSLTADQVLDSLKGDPRLVFCSRDEMLNGPLIGLVASHKLAASRSSAKQLVSAGGLYLNNKPLPDVRYQLAKSDLIDERVAVVRAGKDKHLILALEGH